MRKLGKRFDGVKDTIQANDCGCLCGGCSYCMCLFYESTAYFNAKAGGTYDASTFSSRAGHPYGSK